MAMHSNWNPWHGCIKCSEGCENQRRADERIPILQAHKFGMNYKGKVIHFNLVDSYGFPIPTEDLYKPHYREKCRECSFMILCNGCSDCGSCDN